MGWLYCEIIYSTGRKPESCPVMNNPGKVNTLNTSGCIESQIRDSASVAWLLHNIIIYLYFYLEAQRVLSETLCNNHETLAPLRK
ncbi:MAG: hypothetical protein MI921_05875 [Cytophagales bacterium]|nr:hypothetical protein [Cytophagales bacterium]